MVDALDRYMIVGLRHNLNFLRSLMTHRRFSAGELRGSREGWANHFTPFDQGISCSLSEFSVSHTLRIICNLT